MKYPLLHQRFDEICGNDPEAIAIESGTEKISYEALRSFSGRINELLTRTATGKGIVVTTFLPSGVGLVASVLALLRGGQVYMPVQVNTTATRLAAILAAANSDVILTDSAHLRTVEALIAEGRLPVRLLITIDGDAFGFKVISQQLPANGAAIADGCYLMFTSGTTGAGKPILGSHQGLSQFIDWEISEFGLDASVRVSQLAQTTFDASLRDIFVPLCTGGTLCIPSADVKFQTPRLVSWLKEKEVTLMHCVPSVLRTIIREPEDVFPALKYVLMAGEPLFAKDVVLWRARFGTNVELVNLYGTSETTLAKTFYRIGEVAADGAEALPVGVPITEASVVVDGRPGEIGEIYIVTPYISHGYYGLPEKTAERFVEQDGRPAHRTGDLGRVREDGLLEVLGRQDDQVKVNGIRIELNELEEAILQTEGVSQVVIKAVKEDEAVELACYYTGTVYAADDLRAKLKVRVAEHAIPAYFVHLKEFPLSINGKVDKSALPAVKVVAAVSGSDLTPTETVLHEIWSGVFNKPSIGKAVSFFSLGGTSLKAIRVISQVYKRLEVMITINDLFAKPTIGQLAAHVDGARKKAFSNIRLLPKQETYELSAVQQRIWAIDQFADNKALYNVPEIYLFDGNLDREAFGKALHALVERHEILRTTFELVNDEPRQRVHEASAFGFSPVYLDYSLHDEPLNAAIELSLEESKKTFDLARGPLLRTILIRLSDTEHLFLLLTHHIVSDGWSQEIISRDVLTVYEALAAGKAPALEPLRIQYKDFAAWNNQRLADRIEEHQAFWLEKFGDGVPVLGLSDLPRPERQTFAADETTVRLDAKVSKGLRDLAAKHNASGFNVVMALIDLLLYKYTGRNDIVIGSPIADRGHADVENQVGVYFNTLPFRVRFSGDQRFEQLLDSVKSESLQTFEHIEYPFENILEDLQAAHDPSRNPLFDVGLTHISFLNLGSQSADEHSITVKGIYPGFHFVKSDLWIKAVENGSEPWLFVFSYNTDLFRPAFAAKMIADWKTLAEKVSLYPGDTLDNLIRMTDEARAKEQVQKAGALRRNNIEILKKYYI